MPMSDSANAFAILAELAAQTRAHAQGLPAQVDARPEWSGIGFSLMGHDFVAPIGEISEMLEVPHFTPLPGVQPWVKGIANVRGRLLPIFDLAQFFGERLLPGRKNRRILVLETPQLYAGLMVDSVSGMLHFPVDLYRPDQHQADAVFAPYITGSYRHDGRDWSLLRPALLAEDPRFIQAARH